MEQSRLLYLRTLRRRAKPVRREARIHDMRLFSLPRRMLDMALAFSLLLFAVSARSTAQLGDANSPHPRGISDAVRNLFDISSANSSSEQDSYGTNVTFGGSDRRRVQMIAGMLEDSCRLSKFEQDIAYLDAQCCTRGECNNGHAPTTCPSAMCGKALADLKFGECALTFARMMDTAFESEPDGISEAIEVLWSDCGRLPLAEAQAMVDDVCASEASAPQQNVPPRGGHRRQLTRTKQKHRRLQGLDARLTHTHEVLMAAVNCEDCNGVPYGSAVYNGCHVCNGSPMSPAECPSEYRLIISGTCMDIGMVPILDLEECGAAAGALGSPWSDAGLCNQRILDQLDARLRPEGCYVVAPGGNVAMNPDRRFAGTGAVYGGTAVGQAEDMFEDGFPHRFPICKRRVVGSHG